MFNSLPKDNKLVDIKIIEKWLNDTLKEAKYYDIKPAIQKIRNTLIPMQDYGIDRMTLTYTGFPQHIIDKLYRSYFVNTVGFYNIIHEMIDEFTN